MKRFPELKNTSHPRLKPGENEKLIFFTASAVRGIVGTASAIGGILLFAQSRVFVDAFVLNI